MTAKKSKHPAKKCSYNRLNILALVATQLLNVEKETKIKTKKETKINTKKETKKEKKINEQKSINKKITVQFITILD